MIAKGLLVLSIALCSFAAGSAGESEEPITIAWLERHRGQAGLISGHSDTTPVFANELLGYEHFDGKFDEADYGNLLVVTIACADRRLLHLNYCNVFTVIPQDVVEGPERARIKKVAGAGFRPKNPKYEKHNADQTLHQHIASAL